mgnify:CR=1 FL=1|tara:strand:- start:445 stop:1089 length:645 start_codon:yes stop_codon:yes gene_type:complete
MKKYKVTILIDHKNNWIEPFIKEEYNKTNRRFNIKVSKKIEKVIGQDIVFILSFTKILPKKFLSSNKLNLVIHESNLPKGKGFSPVQWQIIENKKIINVCLLKADEKYDSGPIYLREKINFKGTELLDEIRFQQAKTTIKLINKFLKNFPNIKSKKQIGKSTFYRRRVDSDNEIDINKSIKEQFNILRVSDNRHYPTHFTYRNNKYFIKIFQSR